MSVAGETISHKYVIADIQHVCGHTRRFMFMSKTQATNETPVIKRSLCAECGPLRFGVLKELKPFMLS